MSIQDRTRKRRVLHTPQVEYCRSVEDRFQMMKRKSSRMMVNFVRTQVRSYETDYVVESTFISLIHD